MADIKTCTKCKKKYPATTEFFYKNKSKKDGLSNWCKECDKAYSRVQSRDYYHKNKDVISEKRRCNYQENKEKVIQRVIDWQTRNREAYLMRLHKWREKNIEQVREYDRQRIKTLHYQARRQRWIEENRQQINEQHKKWLARNPAQRVSRRIKTLIYYSLKGNKNGRHWEGLVGYTVEELMAHLEAQFKPGMTWDNYGEWHIDHIRPIASFNFTSPDDPEFRECWALENLQPLWAKENQQKGAKLETAI